MMVVSPPRTWEMRLASTKRAAGPWHPNASRDGFLSDTTQRFVELPTAVPRRIIRAQRCAPYGSQKVRTFERTASALKKRAQFGLRGVRRAHKTRLPPCSTEIGVTSITNIQSSTKDV
eukprot:6203233-Pleurochrysis_carterae.AAC.1